METNSDFSITERRSTLTMRWCLFTLVALMMLTIFAVLVWSLIAKGIVASAALASLEGLLLWPLRTITRYLFPTPDIKSQSG